MTFHPDKKKGAFPPLRSIYFYPTESCNLRCIHCWIKPQHVTGSRAYNRLNRDNISVARMQTVVEQALDLGLVNIKVTGGEPFVCPDIFAYLDCFSKFDISLSIETNATLLSTEKIKRLKTYNIRMLSTSLDGSCAQSHDRIRGVPGSFDKTVRAVGRLVEHGINPQVIFCLQKQNVGDLEATVRLARQIGVTSFEINPLALAGSTGTAKNGCCAISIEQLMALSKKVENHFPEQIPGINVNLYIPPALKGIQSLSRAGLTTCSVFNICAILSNGDVSLCGIGSTQKHLVAGNVKQQPLELIWQKADIFCMLRDNIPEKLEGICGRCLFRFHCLGFCRADILAENRSMTAALPLCQEAFEKGLFPETRILD